MAVILNYSKSVYENKINQLQQLAGELSVHLSTLEGKRNELRNFWDDTQGQKYFDVITEQLHNVRNAIEQVNKMKYTYSDILGGLTTASTTVDSLIEDATFGLKSVLAVGGSGAGGGGTTSGGTSAGS